MGVVEGFNVVGSPSAALVVIDEVLHLAGRELAFIKFHVANDAPHQAVLIFAVQNLKGVGQAGFPGVHAQNTVTYSVKCANPEAFGTHVKQDRKSTRLKSSHVATSYAVFCLKKKKK